MTHTHTSMQARALLSTAHTVVGTEHLWRIPHTSHHTPHTTHHTPHTTHHTPPTTHHPPHTTHHTSHTTHHAPHTTHHTPHTTHHTPHTTPVGAGRQEMREGGGWHSGSTWLLLLRLALSASFCAFHSSSFWRRSIAACSAADIGAVGVSSIVRVVQAGLST